MSTKVMDEVLSRLFLDKTFRQLLRRDPEQALIGYDLTPQERAALSKFKKRPHLSGLNQTESSQTGPSHSFSLN